MGLQKFKQENSNQSTFMWGCVGLFLFGIVLISFGLFLWVTNQREATRYPAGKPVPNQNFTKLNSQRQYLRMENAYLTKDNLKTVHLWYADKFKIRNFNRSTDSGGECISLGRSDDNLLVKQRISITICEISQGQMIWVTRIVSRY